MNLYSSYDVYRIIFKVLIKNKIEFIIYLYKIKFEECLK